MIIRTSPFGTPRPRRHRAPYYRPLTLIQAWLRCLPDDLWASVRHVQRALDAQYKPRGFEIGVQDGKLAGQSVPHVHVHVLPHM